MILYKICKYGFLGGIIYPTGYIFYNKIINRKQNNINYYTDKIHIILLSFDGFWTSVIGYITYSTTITILNYLKQIGSSQ